MFEVTLQPRETDAVDWRELADQVFPAEALRTVAAVNVFTKVQLAHR